MKCFIRIPLTENGIKAQEEGELKNKGQENEAQSVKGSYSYTGPDGVLYEVNYIADENGTIESNNFANQGAKVFYLFLLISFGSMV